MPPIPLEELKAETKYVIVFSNGVQNTMEYRGISKEGYPLFLTKDNEYATQNIEGVTYYKVGDPDIPPTKPSNNAVGGRRTRTKRSKRSKGKRSRKNRHRK